jgi:hypothetical protein
LPRRRTSKAEIQLGMYMILCNRGTIILWHIPANSWFSSVFFFCESVPVCGNKGSSYVSFAHWVITDFKIMWVCMH